MSLLENTVYFIFNQNSAVSPFTQDRTGTPGGRDKDCQIPPVVRPTANLEQS